MIDNLVLENEDLRNAIVNLNRKIVLEEIELKYFFEKNLLDCMKDDQMDDETDDENSGIEDNLIVVAEKNVEVKDKGMTFPEGFLQNAVNVIKSCQRLKITK